MLVGEDAQHTYIFTLGHLPAFCVYQLAHYREVCLLYNGQVIVLQVQEEHL